MPVQTLVCRGGIREICGGGGGGGGEGLGRGNWSSLTTPQTHN